MVALCAFNLLEFDGRNLCSTPIEERKRVLARLIGKARVGIVLNITFEEPGDIMFKHACALGCEGIVSKRLGWRSSRRRFNVDRFDATKAEITVGQEQRPSGIPAWAR